MSDEKKINDLILDSLDELDDEKTQIDIRTTPPDPPKTHKSSRPASPPKKDLDKTLILDEPPAPPIRSKLDEVRSEEPRVEKTLILQEPPKKVRRRKPPRPPADQTLELPHAAKPVKFAPEPRHRQPSARMPEWRHRPDADEITEIRWLPFKKFGVTGNAFIFLALAATSALLFLYHQHLITFSKNIFGSANEARDALINSKDYIQNKLDFKGQQEDYVIWPDMKMLAVRRAQVRKRSSLFEITLDRQISDNNLEINLLKKKGRKRNQRWLVVDVVGVTEQFKSKSIQLKDRRVRKIRFGYHQDPPRQRIVFEYKPRHYGDFRYQVNANRVYVRISDPLKKKKRRPVSKTRKTGKYIRSVLFENEDRFQACYEDALIGKKTLGGKLKISFNVDKAGNPRRIQFEGPPSIRDNLFYDCLRKQVNKFYFPEASGTKGRFSYTFQFKRTK